MVGFGSIGQAILPLLLRHLEIAPQQITILSASDDGIAVAREFGTKLERLPLTAANYRQELESRLQEGDFLLNLSVDVSSRALIALCQQRGVLYLDTCTEPWAGGYFDAARSPSQRSNYALREEVLALRRRENGERERATAVLTMGANPGLASILVKQALLNMAGDAGDTRSTPANATEWAALARDLGIRTIHVAERDTQASARRKQRDEFLNTWSVAGFISEALQPAEMGWGTHERHWPPDGARHDFGCDAAIYLNRPGMAARVRSWTPLEGPYQGFLITHSESISIADHLTLKDNGKLIYRPTVHYAYHPCDDTVLSLHELAGRNWRPQSRKRILRDEIDSGTDELGVLLMGHARNVYWYGSRLSIEQARELVSFNNATSLQVAATILAGIVWALHHPRAGIVEPDDMDHAAVLQIARPYLGELVGVYGDWNPLCERDKLFGEDLDRDDPWQFKNFRVL
jgi:homospermidine synthase